MTPFVTPRLLADIGGTYARFTLETAPGLFAHAARLPCAEHADFAAAVTAYRSSLPAADVPCIEHAAIAIANPVEGDEVQMTNYHWHFSIERMRELLGFESLVVVNDFTALAMSLPRLSHHQRRQVGGGAARERSVLGVLGAGTGLGVSGLIPAADGYIALGTEGGHTSFAPRDEREHAVLRYGLQRFAHLSFERLASGPGIELIHAALLEHAGLAPQPLPAPEITRRAMLGTCPHCTAAVDTFCGVLGTAASDLAVTLGALSGVYIGGGIVPRLGRYFDASPFRQRFEDKGRFSSYVKRIPTYVITAENATFIGASAILAAQLRSLSDDQGSAFLGRIQRVRDTLSPAERRVADHVLAKPRSALADPIVEIARASGVSQPTVIRFCRSLGCEGLSDFKRQLGTGLSATMPLTHTQVTGEDNTLELGAKVLGNTASAILQVREQLNRDALARAIETLAAAQRVEFFAVGHYAVVAHDAQFKFLRLGLPSASYTDTRLQLLAAHVLRPRDVAVIISSSGKIDPLLAVADLAHERGAQVVAITASQSPLARKADVALIVDHVEDVALQLPMISRILHLLVVDIITVGVALRIGNQHPQALEQNSPAALDDGCPEPPRQAAARSAGLGISAAGPLARLTSHSH
jgi:glucokinase